MSLYAELDVGDDLIDSDEVARYCSPGRYDRRKNEPRIGALMRRRCVEEGPYLGMLLEDELSVNRIEHYQRKDRDEAAGCVRKEYLADGYGLSKKGRFVVFNIGAAIAATLDAGHELLVLFTPAPPYHSHSSIFNLPDDSEEELVVATALKRLITKLDAYPGLL